MQHDYRLKEAIFQSVNFLLTYYNKAVILLIVIILPKTVGVINNLKQYPTEAKIDLNVMINDLSSTFCRG